MGTARALLSQLQARFSSGQVHARPTREGLVFGLMLVGVVIAAVNTGNNLLYLVLGTLCSVLVLSSALAEWNLRGLAVRRRLPAEAFAGQPATGLWIVENRRRFGATWALRVEERLRAEGDAGLAAVRLTRVGPGATVELPTRWVFPDRGRVRLRTVRVESAFPFGLVRRWRDLPLPGELLVWPAPLSGPHARRSEGRGTARPDPSRAGREGDFRGLRPYVPGDPLRDLHWPTSARTGQPMVILRTAARADEVVVDVPEARGEHWELALSRAAGQIQTHFGRGDAVGLRIGGALHPPRGGEGWRRRLLDLLASAPRRDSFAP